MPDSESTWELVRATGHCITCDTNFYNKEVARIRSRCAPGGWAYMELRHLPEQIVSELRQTSVASA